MFQNQNRYSRVPAGLGKQRRTETCLWYQRTISGLEPLQVPLGFFPWLVFIIHSTRSVIELPLDIRVTIIVCREIRRNLGAPILDL